MSRDRTSTRQRRGRKCQILYKATIVAFMVWVALYFLRLEETTRYTTGLITLSSVPEVTTDSICQSFLSNIPTHKLYPTRFFQEGAGRPYLSNFNSNNNNFTDIINARFLVFHPHDSIDGNDCLIVFLHIHKNGGTTVERHVSLPTDNFYSKREKELGHERFEAESKRIMDRVWNRQQTTAQAFHTRPRVRVFSFLRDPVTRFLSSVSQVLKLRVWHRRLHPCYETNSTEIMLDCVLEKLETGTIPEMHLAPQSFELYKQTMGNDIYIELTDLSNIGLVMEQLGARQAVKERSTSGSFIRRFPNFRLTMETLNTERIRRICNVYAADVIMIQEANITTTKCLDPEYVSSG